MTTDANSALVRQAIFHVLDGREWDFTDDEQRVDFADAVAAWIPAHSAPRSECELPECQHRTCDCGHAECSHADQNVQPNCSDCDCDGFKELVSAVTNPDDGVDVAGMEEAARMLDDAVATNREPKDDYERGWANALQESRVMHSMDSRGAR